MKSISIAFQPDISKTLNDDKCRYGHYKFSRDTINGIHKVLKVLFPKDINQHFLMVCDGDLYDFDKSANEPPGGKELTEGKSRNIVINNIRLTAINDDICRGIIIIADWFNLKIESDVITKTNETWLIM